MIYKEQEGEEVNSEVGVYVPPRGTNQNKTASLEQTQNGASLLTSSLSGLPTELWSTTKLHLVVLETAGLPYTSPCLVEVGGQPTWAYRVDPSFLTWVRWRKILAERTGKAAAVAALQARLDEIEAYVAEFFPSADRKPPERDPGALPAFPDAAHLTTAFDVAAGLAEPTLAAWRFHPPAKKADAAGMTEAEQ